MRHIDLATTIDADIATVWKHLDNSASWPPWTPIDSHEPVAPRGEDGLGDIRKLRNGLPHPYRADR